MNDYKSRVLVSTMWRFAEQFGTQIIQFIVQLVLARLLLPSDFGLIAMLTVFISISQVFVDSGLGQAIIQKKEIDNVDLSSVFFLNLMISVLLYLILYFGASFVANYYNEPLLKALLRVHGIVILINSANIVQNSLMRRNMEFKKSFFRGAIGILVQGVVGVSLAFMGAGVWAITFSQISRSIANTVVLWTTVKWRWECTFSVMKVKNMLKYGSGILFTSLANSIFINIQTLFIAKGFNSALLGYYNRGDQLPKLVAGNITQPIVAVIFPVFSKQQDNATILKDMIRRFIVLGTFVTIPGMFLLMLISEEVLLFLLTDKWIAAVPFMQLACVKYAFSPLHDANLQALKAIGKSDIFFRLSLIKNFIAIIVLLITVQFGIIYVAIGATVCSIVSIFINIWPVGKYIGYRIREQLLDILPTILITFVTVTVILIFRITIGQSNILITVFIFALLYFLLSYIFRSRALHLFIELMKKVNNLVITKIDKVY